MHGKTSPVHHNGEGLFAGIPSPFEATRYHSLIVKRDTLPDCLEITAETEEGEIMGLRHKELPIHGVQFHPESILTAEGKKLLLNFLEIEA
jgi:anthranilate synthase/aminodeoxychorismate synthase-like glutamine amidotransferase